MQKWFRPLKNSLLPMQKKKSEAFPTVAPVEALAECPECFHLHAHMLLPPSMLHITHTYMLRKRWHLSSTSVSVDSAISFSRLVSLPFLPFPVSSLCPVHPHHPFIPVILVYTSKRKAPKQDRRSRRHLLWRQYQPAGNSSYFLLQLASTKERKTSHYCLRLS